MRLDTGTLSGWFRSVVAVVAGVMLVSMVVETLEFGLVALVEGRPVTDPVSYYGVRNRPWFLGVKLIYTAVAAVSGGYVTAWIAGSAPIRHAVVLAVLQTLAFAWAVVQPDLRVWMPGWMWAAVAAVTAAGILAGARLRVSLRTSSRRNRRLSAPSELRM